MHSDGIKIVGVIDDQPFDQQTWSGSSSYFFNALQKQGVLRAAISARPSELAVYAQKLLNFHPNLKKWKFRYHISTPSYQRMTQTALRKLRSIPVAEANVILQVGAWYNLTRQPSRLTVSYHDGNLAALLESPFGYPQVGRRRIKAALDYEREVYRTLDLIFPMSEWLAGSFRKDFGVGMDKLVPVGAGINLPYTLDVVNKIYDEPNLLFVGRQFERKGGRYLIEAFRIARREIKQLRLTVIGSHLEDLPEGVKCVNYVSKDTAEGTALLLREYAAASLFVMPSLYEPFGIVFAEAMAHKLPCVGTNICAIPEIINDGATGYVVPVCDSEVLAKRIVELVKNPEMARAMGEQGYKRYLEHYTWDRVASKMIEAIEHVA